MSMDDKTKKFTLFGVESDVPDSRLWEPVTVKKIALVWPKGFDPTYSIPLPYAYLKSNLDEVRYEIKIIDNTRLNQEADNEAFQRELREFAPDVVGVSAWSPMFIEALECLKVAKEINPKVVTCIGGAHVTSYHQRVAGTQGIDFIFRGEGDLAFAVFIEQLESLVPDFSKVKGLVYRGNQAIELNDMDREDDLDKVQIPDYDFIDLDYYVRNGYRWNCPAKVNAPVWITRGCPYRCGYCAAPELNGRPVRTHSIEYMMKWVKQLYYERGTRWINIIDDNFTFHKDYAKEFCRALIALDLKDLQFGTPNGIRMERGDKELWSLMKEAGWKMLIVAPETGSEKTIKRMGKGLNLKIVPGVVKDIKDAGLKVQGFFILGYPGESEEDLQATRQLVLDCKLNFVFLASFQPLPGTSIYNELVANNQLVDGLLPHSYSSGTRPYTPEGLAGFNFPKFILLTHLLMMIKNPTNIPYHLSLMFKLFSPKITLKKFMVMFFYSILPKKQNATKVIFSPTLYSGESSPPDGADEGPALIYPPMHQQAQSINKDK